MSDLGWYGRTWHDRKQNERLDSLSSQIESQRSEARRLRSQLANAQGNLEQRLRRLTTAFDAFVELTDLREELRAFQPEAAARHRARRFVTRLVATDSSADEVALPPPAGPSSEMPGYWLPGARAGLVALVQHDTAGSEAELALARDCDATRTDLFVCLALALSRRTDPAAALLPALLDLQPDQPVTRAQRELWLAAARGRFGAQGRHVVADRLAVLVAGLPGGTRAEQIVAWRSLVDGFDLDLPAMSAFPKPGVAPPDLVAPIRAERQLDALADWCQEAMVEPAPVDAPQPDPLSLVLQELVDEGAPDEQPLLDRVAELHRVVEADGDAPSPAPDPWHATVDTPLVLLLADARSTEPGRRAVAARAAGPLLATVADDLGAAAARPVPQQTEVQVGRHTIRYRSMGVDAATVAAAKTATLATPPSSSSRTARLGWAAIASATVVALVGVAAGAAAFGVTLGVVVGGTGAWLLVEARRRLSAAHDEERRRRNDWDRLEQQITNVEAVIAELRAQAARAAEEAPTTRTRLHEQLTAAGSAALR